MKVKRIIISIFVFAVLAILFFLITAKRNEEAITAATGLTVQNAVIVIDAGHGSFDGGASAKDGTVEKDINLSIALKLNDMLHLAGFNTVMTRTDDNAMNDSSAKTIRQKKISDIHNRFGLIESTEHSVLVSIHQNHFSQPKYKGTQVFYSGNNTQSFDLAQAIQGSVVRLIQPDNSRKVKKSGTEIYLLYNTSRPAVMVECGFLSNYDETQLLKNDDYRQKIAFAIMGGIIDFFNNPEDV